MNQADDGREAAQAYRATSPGADAAPDTARAAAPRRGGSGFVGGLLGGLLGTAAVLAAAGWYLYDRGPVRPTLERLAATEAAAQGAGAAADGLRGELGALRGNLEQVTGAVEAGVAVTGELDQRVDANERVLGELAARLEQAGTGFRAASDQVIGRLEDVNIRLAEISRSQPADIVDKGTVAEVTGKQAAIEQAQARLDGGLARLEQLVAQGMQAGNQQAESLRVVTDSNRGRLDELTAGVAALGVLRGDLAGQRTTDDELRQAQQAQAEQLTALRGDFARRIEEVATRLGELDRQRERSVALAVAVDELETAVTEGQAFAPLVGTVGELGAQDEVIGAAVAKLEPRAAGVPTLAALARQLDEVEGTLSLPSSSPPEDWVGRTRENLTGLIDLHAADAEAVPGSNAVQAARQSLLAQDVDGAARALEPLAQAGNAQAAAWVEAARSRQDADATLVTLRQHVRTLLARQD